MKPRIIFFDLEGTIFRKNPDNGNPSTWARIASELGEAAWEAEQETQRTWKQGGYKGYVEWCKATIEIHKKYGLTKKTFEKILSNIEYCPGTHATFERLRTAGIYTAIISGGFKAQADRAQCDLLIDHAFAACEYFWNSDGSLLWWNLLPCDYEGKVDFMTLIMKEHAIAPRECAFVGDGKNDIPLAKAVGMSISFNGHENLEAVCTHKVTEQNFTAILPLLEL